MALLKSPFVQTVLAIIVVVVAWMFFSSEKKTEYGTETKE